MISNLTTEIWFPTFISYSYNTEILPHIQSVFDTFDWQSVLDKRYPNGYTTFYGGYELNENLKNSMPKLCNFILSNAYEILERQHINLGNKKLEITTFWMSRMLKNGFHAKHLHAHSFYSGTYYVNADPTNSSIKFYDARIYKQFAPESNSGEVVEYRPESGKLLLWDSYLEHEVDINLADIPRDAISFNLGIKK
jgi:uncharacterized protein (TIGR02466 family)